ncbi:MAG: peptidoglycan DD-metalloendopeptidase family protein [Gallionella sp.]
MIFFLRRDVLLACLLMAAGAANASQQEELDHLRSRISAMQRDMDKTNASKIEAADALRESERAISDGNRKLAELATRQHEADKQLAELQNQQQNLSHSMSNEQALLGQLLYQQYLGGQQEYAKLLLSNQDPNQVARDLQYYRYIAKNRANWLHSLRNNLLKVTSLGNATREQREVLASVQEEQKSQQQVLQQKQREHQQTLVKISQQLRDQRREIHRLQQDENRLAQLVEKITKMLAQPKSKSIFHNDKLPDNHFDGKPFTQLKGKLAFPLKGEVMNRFGESRPDSTVLWKGIFVKAATGQTVKAIAAGRVVFADWLRGFGNLLIVDHGNGYMSLYGNNETLYKQVGDELHGGDTIATVGNSGGNQDSGLYFELRLESKPLDPLKWLAAK